jgi:large subunit ribosomal protein L22
MKAIARTNRITPKKANLIAGMVRGKSTAESLDILKYTPKKAAKIIFKLLKSAVENAKNNFQQDEKSLFIKEIIIGKGPTLKRSVPVSRGRSHPILKRTSHITILLGIKTDLEKIKKGNKGEEKNSSKKTAEVSTEKVEVKTAKKSTSKTETTKAIKAAPKKTAKTTTK